MIPKMQEILSLLLNRSKELYTERKTMKINQMNHISLGDRAKEEQVIHLEIKTETSLLTVKLPYNSKMINLMLSKGITHRLNLINHLSIILNRLKHM